MFAKLDRVYLQDANWKCFQFHTYLEIENLKRLEDISVDIYLNDFDLRLHKRRECVWNLPDAIVMCRLLKSCDLGDIHFRMAFMCISAFESVQTILKCFFFFAESSHLLPRDSLKVEHDAFFGSSLVVGLNF